jgi:hypothetical protein
MNFQSLHSNSGKRIKQTSIFLGPRLLSRPESLARPSTRLGPRPVGPASNTGGGDAGRRGPPVILPQSRGAAPASRSSPTAAPPAKPSTPSCSSHQGDSIEVPGWVAGSPELGRRRQWWRRSRIQWRGGVLRPPRPPRVGARASGPLCEATGINLDYGEGPVNCGHEQGMAAARSP